MLRGLHGGGGEGAGMGGFGINPVDVYDCYIKESTFENTAAERLPEFKLREEDWVLAAEKSVATNIFLEILYV